MSSKRKKNNNYYENWYILSHYNVLKEHKENSDRKSRLIVTLYLRFVIVNPLCYIEIFNKVNVFNAAVILLLLLLKQPIRNESLHIEAKH